MNEERWVKLEEIVRKVIREEIASLIKGKPKLGFDNGRWVGITEEQMRAWREAYGIVDIEAELKRAAAWILSNPHLAPRSQYPRFLNTWFAKQQNTLALRSIPGKVEVAKPKSCAYCDKPSNGMVNGIFHCRAHGLDAMDEKPRPMRAA